MIGSTQPSPWMPKKILLVSGSLVATFIATAFLLSAGNQPKMQGDIPLPFGFETTNLAGKVTSIGQRNGIDVFEVTYTNSEKFELLQPDRIYLVHIPNASDIIDAPLDVAIAAAVGTGRLVDYYGYRYADAAATLERKDINAILFKDRFPGQFFASAKARSQDATYGNQLLRFEQEKGITFLKTDGSAGSVRMDPLGGLYVFIVNEENGARLFARNGGICGNGVYEPGEQCDDGDTNNDNACTNVCTYNIPIPFNPNAAGTGAKLALSVQTTANSGTAAAGQTGITLMRFDAGAAEPVRLTKVIATAQTGALSDATNYRLMVDTDQNGIVDTVVQSGVTPISGTLTFDSLNSGNGQLIGTSNALAFAIIADVVASPAGSVLQLKLATTVASYAGGRLESPAVPLAGIRTDGTCGVAVCQISVITRPSILWTLLPAPPEVVCGNGLVESGEQCDDSNTDADDGCSALCAIESGYSCTGEPSVCTPDAVCGNGIIDAGEDCDDANNVDTDECTNSCAYPSLGGACLLSGLNAYWQFDEASGVRADSAQSFDISEVFGTVPSGSGILLSAAVGSGSLENSFLLQRDSSALTNADRDFTVAQWLYLPSDRDGSAITSYADNNSNIFWSIGYATFGTPGYNFLIGGVDGVRAISETFGAPVLGEWALVVGSYNATTKEISISVNGGPRDTASFTGSSLLHGTMTGSKLTMLNLLEGDRIDETGIWNRVLTDDEIIRLYNNGNALPFADFGTCDPAPVCGNGVVEGAEQCDDGNTDENDDCDNSCQLTTPLPEF